MKNDKGFTGLAQIGQVNMPVHDLDNAIHFYRDTLGIPFLFQVPRMAFFDCAGVRLLLALPESPDDDHPGSVLYFKVAGIHSTAEALQARGVIFVSEPHLIAEMPDHDLWMAFFKDVDGNLLALMAEVRQENKL